MAKEQENGVEDVKAAGRAAGLSEEAIEDTLESGGILAVPVECYAQSEASPALLETVSFSPGAEPMARMKASAAAFYEEAEARLKETIARQKRLEETITKELFPTEGEERNLAMEAMTINPDNPAQGWRAMKEEIEGQRSDVLAEAWDAIEKGLPKENGQAGAAWYETWKKEHGHAPKEEDLEAIAYALTVGEDAPQVEGFNQGAEVSAIRAAAKENLEAIDKKRKALDAIKERMTELTGIEMRQTETLTGEGYRVYRHILSDLKSADNPKVTRAARISALLFARHADIYAAAMRKRGGEYAGYTAMDYYNKAFALDISGRAPEDGERLNQAAMRAGIDLNQEVPVLDITEQIPGKNLTKQDKKELLSYIRSLAEQKEHGLTADGLADIGIMPKNAKHIAYSSFFAPPMPMRIRAGAIQTIGDLIKNAVLVESIPNRKMEKKPHVRAYHRFYVPVRFARGNDYQVETIRLVAEERDGEITINPTAVELYDVIIEEENRFPSGVKPLMDRSDSPLVITIRDLLRNVKDADGKPYLSDKEKAAISGTETENPSLYQEAANAQMAAERLKADAKAWKKTLKEAWAGKMSETQMFRVMETPLVLQLVGAKALPIYMAQKKLMQVKKEHPELNKTILNKLPEQLADPMMIFQSETVPGRIVVCLELKDEAGANIVVPVELNAKNDRMEINILASIYGKGNPSKGSNYSWFLNNVLNGNALYINKKQAANLYRAAGLQLPMEGRKFNDLFGSSIKTEADLVKEKMKNPSLYQEAHGYTQFLSNGQRLVTLMESADESTFLHELGHVFLDDLRILSAFDEASQKELATVDEWAAWHEGAAKEYQNTPWEKEFKTHEAAILAAKKSGDAKALEKALKVWRHERFARAFERYLKEGEAPARGLKQVFRKFAAFLRSIYQAFTSDGGRASMEVERVMDRMIATDEEIEDAAQDKRYRDFTKAGGEKLLRESDKSTYQRWHEKAKAEAKERLRKVVTKKLERERKAKLSAEIKNEEERFRTKLYEEPIYQAREAVEMAKDEKAALLFYPTVEEYREQDQKASAMETLVKEHMEDYRRTREKALLENAITPDEVEKAMAGTEYHARLMAYEAKAFAKQADALRRISGKAQAAMEEVEEKIEEMPEAGRASAEEAELTKEEVTARIKEAVQGMDEKDIPKIPIQDAHRFDGIDEQALFAVALQEMKKLTAEKIADPLGHEIYFAPGETETLESYVLHLIAGRGKQVEDIRTKRVLGLSLAKETIAHPLAIIVQENGRLAYLALYTDGTNFQNSIIVGVEEGQEGRVVTSMLTADKKGDKKAAVREFKKRISGSKEVLYWEGQSGHSRPSSETWASTLNAKLHPSGNFSIAEDDGKSKGAGKSEKKTDTAKEKYSARDLYRAIHRLRSAHRWGAEELSAIDALGKAASKADLKAAWEKAKELITTEHLAEQELKEALRGQSQLYRELARKEIANMTITEASAIMTFRRQEKESAARVERLVKAENWAAAEKIYTRLKTTPSTRCPAVSSGRRRLPGHR